MYIESYRIDIVFKALFEISKGTIQLGFYLPFNFRF